MGVVYAAHHDLLHQDVALKLLLPEVARNKEAVTRFVNEGRATARLQSAHVVRVMDVGMFMSSPFLVMELLMGWDLGQLLEKRGPLLITETVDYLLQAMEGLSHAHAAGIIHRDLKPSNLFLAEIENNEHAIKVVDFGISKAMGTEGNITQTSAVLGSPAYMSPEQLRSSKNVDARADIWSLGVIAFELMTGKMPFAGETVGEIFANVLEKPPLRPRALRGEVPGRLEEVILRCLDKSADARFGNVAELATALGRFGTGKYDSLVAAIEKKTMALSVAAPRAPTNSVPDLELAPSKPTLLASKAPPAPISKPVVANDEAWDWHDDVPAAKILTAMEGPVPSKPTISISRPGPVTISKAPPRDIASTLIPVATYAAIVIAVFGVLWRFAGRKGGWSILELVPSATDGSSVKTTAIVTLVCALAALTTAVTGLLGRERRWGLVVSTLGLFVMLVGMLIVLASTMEARDVGPEPQGAFLVPLGAPLVLVGLAISCLGKARVMWQDRDRGFPPGLAALAGALLFGAFELAMH